MGESTKPTENTTQTSGHQDIPQNEVKTTTLSPSFDCAMFAMQREGQFVDDELFGACELNLEKVGNWNSVPVRPASEVFHSKMIWQPVRILGRIELVKGPRPVSNDDDETYSAASLLIRADDQSRIETTAFPLETFAGELDVRHLVARQTRAVFSGALIPIWRKKGGDVFYLYLKDIKLNPSPSELSPMRPYDGVDHPRNVIQSHPSFNGMLRHIKERLAAMLGILELDKAKELNRALDLVILQAFSYGKDGYSQRLHGLVIGPPGVGKSFLTKAALKLNARAEEVSSIGGKITPAGLIGEVRKRSGRSFPVNGILPRNSGGVVCIQDFHHVRGARRNQVCTIFSQLMEDGEVTDSTSSGVTLEAETALLLDMNRQSHVNIAKSYDAFADIDIPVNVLTRFDSIIEIHRDGERQAKLAKEILSNPGSTGSRGTLAEWQKLRDVITWMKQEYGGMIVRSEPVNDHILKKADELFTVFQAQVKNQLLWVDFQTRIARSVDKFLRAIATANATREVSAEMVDFAFEFVAPKFEFLCKIGGFDADDGSPIVHRENLIRDILKNRQMSVKEIEAEMKRQQPDEEISEKMVQRALQDMGAQFVSKGKKWKLM